MVSSESPVTRSPTCLLRSRTVQPRACRRQARSTRAGIDFGAGVSALLLIVAALTNTPWLVAVVLASIGVSAAFGLRYSIYGVIWRRIVKVAQPRSSRAGARVSATVRAGPREHGARPVTHRLRPGRTARRLAVRPRGRRAPEPPRDHRLLPGLPPVLPALVGPRPSDSVLGPSRLDGQPPHHRTDQLPLSQAGRHGRGWRRRVLGAQRR